MDKKDIYEHLAKIYLDSSKKHKKKKKKHSDIFAARNILAAALVATIISSLLFIKTILPTSKRQRIVQSIALVIQPDAVKINYNFSSAKKEIYTLQLKGLNLSEYKQLAFSAKILEAHEPVSLRIELVNSFQEKSEVYVKDIATTWKELKIALSDFKKITNWSGTKELQFIVEEWNAKGKNNVIYIENIRFLK